MNFNHFGCTVSCLIEWLAIKANSTEGLECPLSMTKHTNTHTVQYTHEQTYTNYFIMHLLQYILHILNSQPKFS